MALVTLKEILEKGKRGYGEDFTLDRMTCFDCPHAVPKGPEGTVCEFAWDLYNTNGDCLALK